jgi:hypothetical protein
MKYLAILLLFAASGSKAPSPARGFSCTFLPGTYKLSNRETWRLHIENRSRPEYFSFTCSSASCQQNPEVVYFQYYACQSDGDGVIICQAENLGHQSLKFFDCTSDVCETSGIHYQKIVFIRESGQRLTGAYCCNNDCQP